MSLITLPASPEKGLSQEYSLNTTELFALVSDSYFTTQTNLRVIEVVYKSSISNQIELISFIPNGSEVLTTMAEFAPEAREEFFILNIVIVDKQNGRFIVANSEIPDVTNYEISFSSSPVSPLWELYGSPDVVNGNAITFNPSGFAVRRQAFTKEISMTGKSMTEFSWPDGIDSNGFCFAIEGFNGDPSTYQVSTSLNDYFYDPQRSWVLWVSVTSGAITIYKNSTQVFSGFYSQSASDVMDIYVDADAKTVLFGKNGDDGGLSWSWSDQPSYTQLRFAGYRGDLPGTISIASTPVYPRAGYLNIIG